MTGRRIKHPKAFRLKAQEQFSVKKPAEEIDEKDDELIMSIRLKSGRFASEIQVPLFATDAERQDFVAAWFKMMEAGIRCGNEHRSRTKGE